MEASLLDQAFRASPLFQELEGVIESRDFSRFDSDARRQHFVPRFLLNDFAVRDNGRHWIYQLDTTRSPAPRRVQTNVAASRRHFYSMLDEEGNRNNRIEGFLSRVESHAAMALDRFVANPLELADGNRATLSFFFALQDHRTPAGIERMGVANDTAMRLILVTEFSDPTSFAFTYRRLNGDAPEEEIEALRIQMLEGLRDGSIGAAEPQVRALGLGFSMAAQQSQVIFMMDWTILQSEATFITSERGLAIHDPSPPFPWSSQALLSSPDAETTIPLSTSDCLRLRPGDQGTGVEAITHRDVDLVNLRTFGWAEGYVYGPTQQVLDDLRRLARRRPDDVVRPRRRSHVIVFEREEGDDSVAQANRHRGWPPRLLYDGVEHDYIVVWEGENPVEAMNNVSSTVRERAFRAMGLPEGAPMPGGPAIDFGLGLNRR